VISGSGVGVGAGVSVGVGAVVGVVSCVEVGFRVGVTVGGIVHSADVTFNSSDEELVSAAGSPQDDNNIAMVIKSTGIVFLFLTISLSSGMPISTYGTK
jgi:hypothetical protein